MQTSLTCLLSFQGRLLSPENAVTQAKALDPSSNAGPDPETLHGRLQIVVERGLSPFKESPPPG